MEEEAAGAAEDAAGAVEEAGAAEEAALEQPANTILAVSTEARILADSLFIIFTILFYRLGPIPGLCITLCKNSCE